MGLSQFICILFAILYFAWTGNQSIHQYWQNEFHFLDKPCSTTDLITTFANSFIRRSVQLIYTSNDRCELAGFELIETHVLNVADKFDR